MCHDLLFLCFAFSIHNLCSTTAAGHLLLSIGFTCFTYRCFVLICLSCDWSCFFLLYWLFFGHGRHASDEAFPIGNNIVNRQDGKFLAMTATMAETLLRFVPENNQLFAAVLLNGSCKHHGIVQQRSTDHRAIGIRDE